MAGHPNQAGHRPFKPKDVARAQILEFLFQFDTRSGGIPKDIDPDHVPAVLVEALGDARINGTAAGRLADLADFYDARAIVPEIVKRLDRQEQTDRELLRSISLTGAIALLGDGEARSFGRAYYRHLLYHPMAPACVPALIMCFAEYAPEESSALLRGRIDELVAALEAQSKTDPTAQVRALNMGDLRGGLLLRAEESAALKAQIMSARDPAARLDQLIDIYLDVDMRLYEFMRRWAVRMIQREASAGSAPVVAGFRRAIERLGVPPPDETAQARRSRCLRAVEFFGGEITVEERASLGPFARLFDLLSTE